MDLPLVARTVRTICSGRREISLAGGQALGICLRMFAASLDLLPAFELLVREGGREGSHVTYK